MSSRRKGRFAAGITPAITRGITAAITPAITTAITTAAVIAFLATPAFALPGDADKGPVSSPVQTIGPNPTIAPVDKHLITTVQIAPAKGWPAGG
jgi:hypothetical protein